MDRLISSIQGQLEGAGRRWEDFADRLPFRGRRERQGKTFIYAALDQRAEEMDEAWAIYMDIAAQQRLFSADYKLIREMSWQRNAESAGRGPERSAGDLTFLPRV